MRIIVVGHGRLGSQVVKHLDTQQNEVIVIDKQRELLRRPDRDPSVRFIAGNATDPDLLREAGAEQAGALFALTRDENTNLMVAQVARTVFRIQLRPVAQQAVPPEAKAEKPQAEEPEVPVADAKQAQVPPPQKGKPVKEGADDFASAFASLGPSTSSMRTNRPTSGSQPVGKKRKIGRNDPCWCGSGKKFKKCHYPQMPPN